MEYRKLSKLQKWYLKYTDRPAYKNYKEWLRESAMDEDFQMRTAKIQHPSLNHAYKELTTFKHSGNAGDIIYSLPAVFELSKKGKANLYLQSNQTGVTYLEYHPLGNRMLNDNMISMLEPLLNFQPRIALCKKYEEESIDYDLDTFRSYTFYQNRGSITRWYFNVYGISANTSEAWLIAPKDDTYKNKIIIARSHRYRTPLISYKFLEKYSNKLFIGVEKEYEDMRKEIPDLEFKPVNDFLEMATIINSCRLFIGNQSFPFALAESLKITRLLEAYYKGPNVVVEGKGANDFFYQPQFEYAVQRLLTDNSV